MFSLLLYNYIRACIHLPLGDIFGDAYVWYEMMFSLLLQNHNGACLHLP